MTASAAASGGIACPASTAGGAATICAVGCDACWSWRFACCSRCCSCVSGEQQRKVESRSRGRCSRSSRDGTDRRAKKRSRRRSPSPEDRYQSGAGCRSPGPSGAAEDDRSTTFESVDFARDDSFRAVLASLGSSMTWQNLRGCKTSLASAYGLMSETSPAFTLPASPLLSTLLADINLSMSKFLKDQTMHGFLPMPGRRHRRYYSTSSSSFPGPYTVPPGVTSITLERASEVKKRFVSLSASQVSSMETMLSGMCEVSPWLDWWLSTCGGFRDHLPIEVRADFERLMISSSGVHG